MNSLNLLSLLCLNIVNSQRCSSSNVCKQDAPCCSAFSFCGVTTEHCGKGCNAPGSFNGKCAKSTSINKNSPKNAITSNNGKCTSWNVDFGNQNFKSILNIDDGPHDFVNGNLRIKYVKTSELNPETRKIIGYSATLKSKMQLQYGTLDVKMSAARIGGVVTAITLMSDDKDEIDFEWVGKNENEVQTNFYNKGIIDYTNGKFHPLSFNTHKKEASYKIVWKPNSVEWYVNGKLIRSHNKSAKLDVPSSPSYLIINVWDGGSGAEGTRDWAGGEVNYNDGEFMSKNFIDANIKSIKYKCL